MKPPVVMSSSPQKTTVSTPSTGKRSGGGKLRDRIRKQVEKQFRQQRAQDAAAVLDPLTPQQIGQTVKASARQKYQPAIREAKGDIRASKVQSQHVGDWFADYQKQLSDIAARTTGAYQQAQTDVTNQANVSSQLAAQQNAGLAAQMQADALQRGATVDPSIQTAAQQAAASRRSSSDAFGAMLAANTATRTGFEGDRQAIAGAQRIQAGISEQGIRRKLRQNLGALLKEKGDFKVTTKQSLIDSERKNQLERAAFDLNKKSAAKDAALNAVKVKLDQKNKQAELAQKNADRAQDAQQEAEQVNKWGYTNAEWRSFTPAQREAIISQQAKYGKTKPTKANPAKKSEPQSSLQVRRVINIRQNAVTGYIGAHPVPHTETGRHQLVGMLKKDHPNFFTPDQQPLLSAALDLYFDGRISKVNLAYLHKLGVFIGPNGGYRR